jgi:hypothetical protein
MASEFERITGPRADVNELEYVSALHQTGAKFTRSSGTVSALDIRRYLRSRHGLDISADEARDVVQSLGGGGHPPPPIRNELIQQKMAQEKAQIAAFESMASRKIPKPDLDLLVEDGDQEDNENGMKIGALPHRTVLAELLSSGKQAKTIATPRNSATPSASALKKSTISRKEKKKFKELDQRQADLQALVEEMKQPKMMYMDIVQMTSTLMIPTIARYGQEWKNNHRFSSETERVKEETEPVVQPANDASKDASSDEKKEPESSTEIEVLRTFAPSEDNSPLEKYQEEESPVLLPPEISPDLLEFILNKLWTVAATTAADEPDDSSGFRHSTVRLSSALLKPPKLDRYLVELLLVNCGLHEWAYDDDLIQRMVDVAKSPTGCLDARAFVSALTSDLDAWQVDDELKESTYACDVFGPDGVNVFPLGKRRKESISKHVSSDAPDPSDSHEIGNGNGDEDGNQLQNSAESLVDRGTRKSEDDEVEENAVRIRMAKAVDFVVDAFNSFCGLILIWGVFICFSGSYVSLVLTLPAFQVSCDPTLSEGEQFGCVLVGTIWSWLVVALLLVLFGMIGEVTPTLAFCVIDDLVVHFVLSHARFSFPTDSVRAIEPGESSAFEEFLSSSGRNSNCRF